jgi:hypothetical protein
MDGGCVGLAVDDCQFPRAAANASEPPIARTQRGLSECAIAFLACACAPVSRPYCTGFDSSICSMLPEEGLTRLLH